MCVSLPNCLKKDYNIIFLLGEDYMDKIKIIFFIISVLFIFNSSFAIENKISFPALLEKIQQSDRDKRQYEVIELANQMRVLLVFDPKAAKSLGSLALPVGSLQDPKDQQGLAHYTEHMVLMGSKSTLNPQVFLNF